MDRATRRAFLAHQGSRQLAFVEGRNATVSVWESDVGRSLRVNGKVDASDRGDMGTQVMIGLAPVVARPAAARALVIGYGSGVTAHVLAATPGMREVRVIEIEPAVLAMDTFFRHVNGHVLAQPGVSTIVDDARSALQLQKAQFDVIVSEPSNPWIAGIATLYTPEFFRVAKARLSDSGVFCQWVQLYQLPLPIVAGIVRNLRAVFPNVEVWFGEYPDLLVLGSAQPIRYDSARVRQIFATGGALTELAREWVAVDTPAQYFGHRLLGPRGVDSLLTRATFEHTDDHPRLEFVAARSFLEPGLTVGATFDSLAKISLAAGDGAPPLLLARTLAVRRSDLAVLPYVEALRSAETVPGEFTVRDARIRLVLRDTATAELLLSNVYARGHEGGPAWADARLLDGLIAIARHEPAHRSASFLGDALAGGGDTAQARAALALLAVRDSLWRLGASQALGALRAGTGSFRHPHAASFLTEALTSLTLDAPPALADSVMAFAVAHRPGMVRYRELRALAAIRAGSCDVAAGEFVEMLQFGVRREDGPALVQQCWATRTTDAKPNRAGVVERSVQGKGTVPH
jgi:spermidine synthase